MGLEETPDEFVNQLTFKRKLFGGCGEENILLKMYQVCDVYK